MPVLMLHGLFISGVVFTLHSHFITSPILSISTFNHHIKSCYTWKATVSISVSWQPVLRMETDDHYEKGVEEHWEIWGSFNAPSATFWTLKACLLWHSLVLFVFLIIFFFCEAPLQSQRLKTAASKHCICTQSVTTMLTDLIFSFLLLSY